jgi:DNA-binding CsgD family transcriptional regulator
MGKCAAPSNSSESSSSSEGSIPETIGICVKDSYRRIHFQNRRCIEICGQLAGEVCVKTCMRQFVDGPEGVNIALGTHVDLCILADDGLGGAQLVDAVVINDGRSIVTVLSSVPERIVKARAAVSECKLTSAQQRVFDLVLQGCSNQEIAKTLFISIPTVRTHLTRIYQKVPKEILLLVLAGSARLTAAT